MTPRTVVARLTELVDWALSPDVHLAENTDQALTIITDTVSVIIAASQEVEVAGFARVSTTPGGGSTLLATGERATAFEAARANGLAAVRLELDEGNQYAANHPSAHTLPALLAEAEQAHRSGNELIVASAAAYEVAVRVARGISLRPTVHPFGTAMACGSAVGIARLRGLDPATTVRAALIATALSPASTQRAANSGATVRNAITGVCAANGILAVDLATTGTSADDQALQTVFGEVLGDSYDARPLDDDLGGIRYLTRNYFKLHACSRWNHAPIEATQAILDRDAIAPDEVVGVRVATFAPATRLNGKTVTTGFAGKHSIPYSVAARIVLRHNGIDAYTDEVAGYPRIQRIMGLVDVVEDPALTDLVPDVRAARVTINLSDGRTLEGYEDHAPGGFDRPYPAATLTAKHRELLCRALPESAVDEVIAWAQGLRSADDVGGLHDILTNRP